MKMLKMGLLGLMLGAGAAFATATVGSEEAAAMPCCSNCESGISNCQQACTDIACYDQCEADWFWCTRRCSSSC